MFDQGTILSARSNLDGACSEWKLVTRIPLLCHQIALFTVTGYLYLSYHHYRASREPVDPLYRGSQHFLLIPFSLLRYKIPIDLFADNSNENWDRTSNHIDYFEKYILPAYFILKRMSSLPVLQNYLQLSNNRFCKHW